MGQFFSRLGIANKALYKIGAQRLASLDDSNNPNAIFINDIYNQCLIEVLEEHVWSFAIQTVPLTQLTLSVALPDMGDGVSTAYGLPSDFISPYLFSAPCTIRKEMIKSPYVPAPILALLSDNNNLKAMKYVFENNDPTTYTAKFYEALACKLAHELCFKISEAAQFAVAIKAEYDKALLSAIASDSNSSTPDQAAADEWFIARLAGSANLLPWGVTPGSPSPEPY